MGKLLGDFIDVKQGHNPRFPISLRGSWFGINRRFRLLLENIQLTPVQYTVLRNLFESKGVQLNQQKLASLLSSNENNLTSILNRLESLGMIQRVSKESDRRKKFISLSAKGKHTFLQARKQAEFLQSRILLEFTEKESTQLLLFLDRCSKKLDSLKVKI